MDRIKPDNWTSVELDSLISDVLCAAESGEIDSAFENIEITSGNLARSKNTGILTKNYLMACVSAGVQGVSETSRETALGLVNAFRRKNAEAPLDELPEDFKVFAIKLPCDDGNPDIEYTSNKATKSFTARKSFRVGSSRKIFSV